MFGWRPKENKVEIPPIPLCFGLVEYNIDEVIKPEFILFLGVRYQNSFQIHERFSNKTLHIPKLKFNEKNNKIEIV